MLFASNVAASNVAAREVTASNVAASNVAARNVSACNVSAKDVSACNLQAATLGACNVNAASLLATSLHATTLGACNISACNLSLTRRVQLQAGATVAHAAHRSNLVTGAGMVPWAVIADRPAISTPRNATDPLAVAGMVLGAAGLATALGALFAGDGSLGQQLLDQLGKAFNKDYDPLDADDTDPQG